MSEDETLSFSMVECPSCSIRFFFDNTGFHEKAEDSDSTEKLGMSVYCPRCGSDFPFFLETAPKGVIETEERESVDDNIFSASLTEKDWEKVNEALKITKTETNKDFLVLAADHLILSRKPVIELLKKTSRDLTVPPISNLERLIEILEFRLAEMYIQSSSEKVDLKHYEKESNIFALGLKTAMTELNKLKKILINLDTKKTETEEGFYFYENLGKPLNEVALSLVELLKRFEDAPISSIEFHHKRGDFSKWIKIVLKYKTLAKMMKSVDSKGEELRRRLINILLSGTLK